MTRLKSRLPFYISVFAIVLATACSLFTTKNIQTALDIAKVLCIVANAESDDQTVKTVCNIVESEESAFRSVLQSQRAASRRYASSLRDAGAETGAEDGGH